MLSQTKRKEKHRGGLCRTLHHAGSPRPRVQRAPQGGGLESDCELTTDDEGDGYDSFDPESKSEKGEEEEREKEEEEENEEEEYDDDEAENEEEEEQGEEGEPQLEIFRLRIRRGRQGGGDASKRTNPPPYLNIPKCNTYTERLLIRTGEIGADCRLFWLQAAGIFAGVFEEGGLRPW